jgi:putative GTP pyrophosphokinase
VATEAAIEETRKRYLRELPQFLNAAHQMESRLVEVRRLAGVRAEIEAREKSIVSVIKKLHLKGSDYQDPWLDLTDKVGARLITETLRDLSKVRAVFEDPICPLRVVRIEDKSTEADENMLFYPGIHVQVIVPGVMTSEDEPIECEVQLRTKAQDLWSVPSHQLVYKPLIEAPREIRRRVLRLSVLVEIFDEEVRDAMAEVESIPGYEEAVLLRTAEGLYFTFVSEPGDQELSFEVLDRLGPILPQNDDVSEFATHLSEFAEANRPKLSEAYRQFGPYSAFAGEWAYWLVSQPESIIVWFLISSAPMQLAEVVRSTDLEGAMSQLFAIWGSPFPEET